MIKLTTIGCVTIIAASMSLNHKAYATDVTTEKSTANTNQNVVSNPPQNNTPAASTPSTKVNSNTEANNTLKKDNNRKQATNKKENQTWTNKLKDKWKEKENKNNKNVKEKEGKKK